MHTALSIGQLLLMLVVALSGWVILKEFSNV